MKGGQIDSLLLFSQAIFNSIFQRHYNDHIYHVYKNNIYYLLNTFLLLVDDLKRIWKNLRESYTRCKRGHKKLCVRVQKQASCLPINFTKHYLRFSRKWERKWCWGRKPCWISWLEIFKAWGEKQARQYGNTDQKRLMYSLNNVDRQLKEVTDNANKNMANSNFLFWKSLVDILDGVIPG